MSKPLDLKDTINLPKTSFSMKANLPQAEPRRLEQWRAADLYGQIRRARAGQPSFVLHDGPPHANGHIHYGHILNKILKDIVEKSRTMEGHKVPYVPGWDCHGLPIEFKVVKQAAGLGPAEIRRRCSEFAKGWIDVQRGSFRRLGVCRGQRPPAPREPASSPFAPRTRGVTRTILLYHPSAEEARAYGDRVELPRRELFLHVASTPAEAMPVLADTEILYAWGFPSALLARMRRLRFIQVMGAGVEPFLVGPGSLARSP